MIRPLFLGILCAVLLVLPTAVPAQQKVVISYSTLGMNQLLDGSLIDVNSDGANRVWAVTPGRVSAALGTDRVPLFPITVADAGLVPGTSFSGAAFAVPAGNSSDGEHFYLGSSRGIAWGRLAANVDHRGILRVSAALVDADVVNGISSDGSTALTSTGSGRAWRNTTTWARALPSGGPSSPSATTSRPSTA